MLRVLIPCVGLGLLSACTASNDATESESSVSPELERLCAEDLELGSTDCEKLSRLALPDTLPKAHGNRYADDEPAAFLGFRIFYDARIAGIEAVRCATCHQPERYFGDGVSVPEVVSGRPGRRNSLSILTAAWMGPYVFWDGRADSLWSQPLFAFEHPDEMASTRLKLAHVVYDDTEYRAGYEAVFGALPPLDDLQRFPAEGKPGDASFDQMSSDDQVATNRVAANIGKALEAYMRKVAIGPGALELYLEGDREAMSEAARRGLQSFVSSGCIDCHSGPALSDGAFHRIAETVGDDPGRAAAFEILESNPFNLEGQYADPENLELGARPQARAEDQGAFRTPSLRAISLTGPYGHAGQYSTLRDVLTEHASELDSAQHDDLLVFLMTLDGRYPERPWSDWPVL